MNKGIFITGTDTGIGKTFVACGLIRAMKEKGMNVCPIKPVESGCRSVRGELIPSDTKKLIKASGIDEPIDLINPYRLKHPLAPSVAAKIEGVAINKKKIFSAYKRLSKKYDITVVEGAGGIMVPVYKKYLFLDLAKDLDIPVVIVARPGLGTINHTLLTIEALRSNGLSVAGVIINCAVKSGKGLSEKTNPEVIEKLGGVPVLGSVPHDNNTAFIPVKKVFVQIIEKMLLRLMG
ncbi:MAG: dethiobiotin synthase [Nitrospirota bacterium]